MTVKLKGNVSDVTARLIGSVSDLAIQRSQYIPDDFMDDLKEAKHLSSERAGAFHRVCSVPVAWVEKWRHEGFDIYKESAKAIIDRLKKEQLDHFITTNKRI